MKTYSHLAALRRIPTEYEIATGKLHYYLGRGFEVNTPLAAWYAEHQSRSRLTALDAGAWEQFRDPRETTYTRYVTEQSTREAHVAGLHRAQDDGVLAPAWRAELSRLVPPLRFLVHGLQMIAAYVGQMAPASRITVAAALQAADEMRFVQRLAERMVQLRAVDPGFGEDARERWQHAPEWQPLRELIEKLLVAWDWGESFAGLCLAVKPVLDTFFTAELAERARAEGDFLLRELCFSIAEDRVWHRAWARALCAVVIEAAPSNREALAEWVARWWPAASRAAMALGESFGSWGVAAAGRAAEKAHAYARDLGVSP